MAARKHSMGQGILQALSSVLGLQFASCIQDKRAVKKI
jgi:hypothetical protein